MTIDGVANIDTGDNGGNMATTNIDAVAEFKILTNAYQAEYGRAVGGQVQVVTKSGTQAFHGSGYWYGRRSDWNANSWTEQARRRRAVPKATETSRNDYGYTLGGPVSSRLQHGEEEAVLLLEPGVRSGDRPRDRSIRARGPDRPGAPGRLLTERGQQRQPVPVHSRLHHRAALQCRPTRAAASRTAACSAGFRRTASTRRASTALNIFPTANFSGGSGLNFTSQVPDSSPRREDLLRLDFQATNNWRSPAAT